MPRTTVPRTAEKPYAETARAVPRAHVIVHQEAWRWWRRWKAIACDA